MLRVDLSRVEDMGRSASVERVTSHRCMPRACTFARCRLDPASQPGVGIFFFSDWLADVTLGLRLRAFEPVEWMLAPGPLWS